MNVSAWNLGVHLSPQFGTSTWLLQLRWMAVLGQLITVAIAWGVVDSHIPLVPLLLLIGLTASTNLVFGIWLWRSKRWVSSSAEISLPARDKSHRSADLVPPGLMLLDLGTLTAMLYFTGGAVNPFALFYFVNLAVGGVILRPRWAWGLTAFAIVAHTALLEFYRPLEQIVLPPLGVASHVSTLGLAIAFTTCAAVVTFFVTHTAAELTRRQQQLRRSEEERTRSRQLEGLTTLAAGAAHELATPLSTIDVVVRELGRHLEECQTPPTVEHDLKLIDHELESCRQILLRMRAAAGDQSGQSWQRTTVEDLIDTTLDGVRDPHRVDVVDGPESVEQQVLWLPQEAVAQAIRNLIHNGLDAGGPESRVRIEACLEGDQILLKIDDFGEGMSSAVLGRIGEPFFTTKEPGRGMGLGLFLTRNLIAKLGGQIKFDSHAGKGTTVSVLLPIDAPATR
ncbi:Sensor histidine kinase RegB [Roseimaritima multifibrata]|uniref:histidine kinase n=1 Tax=Roseimaritima multifibrata TaxID=1930274 RepID=A0A517MJ72_9BACT|nr:ATP-binding protein [Roseimaritima multifibrata]QDS94951.1 Sensor histidine kinase RegB [Roseimaritima multifibrata]